MDGTPKIDATALMLDSLRGTSIDSLEEPAKGMWHFHFTSAGLIIECPWRVVNKGVVVLGADDDGQRFGLPEPVSVLQQFPKLIENSIVTDLKLHDETADLSIFFGDDLRLEAFNDSSGYEGWKFSDAKGMEVIATGGGDLAIWARGQAHQSDAV